MTREEILRLCDHTLLRRDMSTLDMKRACDEAIEFNTASVCLPPILSPRQGATPAKASEYVPSLPSPTATPLHARSAEKPERQ